MDAHESPYFCTHVNCPRHKRGFTRKDNLMIRIQKHRGKNQQRFARARSEGSPELKAEVGESVRMNRVELRNLEREVKRYVLKEMKRSVISGFHQMGDEEDEEMADGENDDDEGDENDVQGQILTNSNALGLGSLVPFCPDVWNVHAQVRTTFELTTSNVEYEVRHVKHKMPKNLATSRDSRVSSFEVLTQKPSHHRNPEQGTDQRRRNYPLQWRQVPNTFT
ncbi:hypothetical protein K440DRAFT_640606 [Wilcoxina mikolae CBS 423.85]|nr:hypothetical protein K440DRAFT_640606 [Wilcoxina mikolae CBS 423.85]